MVFLTRVFSPYSVGKIAKNAKLGIFYSKKQALRNFLPLLTYLVSELKENVAFIYI
jgi:hypothetical protein